MEKAYLEILDGSNKRLPVRFNPQSLQVNYHAVGPKGSKNREKDAEKQGARDQQTGALADIAMDLIFDTSEEGKDVRNITVNIAALVNPQLVYGKSAPAPPLVRFHWGTFVFNGKVLSVSETIDFFSEQGVPLRSTVKLSMSEVQRERGNPGIGGGAGVGASAGIGLSASAGVSAGAGAGIGFSASASLSAGIDIGTTPLTLAQAGDSLQALAGRAGVGASWKAIASANNIDNPRSIAPGTPVNLSAGASASAGASFDGGTASASASAGASASFGAGA
jgi:contractile injection system tube protein/LysM domain-containing protein